MAALDGERSFSIIVDTLLRACREGENPITLGV